ncbi:hypothetical protein FACS1894179_02710 [Bacteroidia bacterium]|nr:hypothetical protein FACS1894169_02890 [Bacteroidia bacterium]GHV38779.1 hypothetical protein FACS1894179_02710 [Bacteroidia bacterium]
MKHVIKAKYMKMLNIKKSILLSGLVLLLAGCTGNFEEFNTDPNNPTPEQTDPKFVLTATFSRTMLASTNYQNIQLLNPDIYAQFYANDLGITYNSYNQVDGGISSFWTDIVYYYLNSLNTVIRNFSDKPEYANMVQMARIWKCWLMLRATDFWGDVPYFKACDGSNEAAPYDNQKDIYYDIFTTLADAASKFDDSKINIGKQDIIFDGTNAKWIKFANSLRLRMAIRISHVDAAKAKTEAESAIAGGVVSNDAETVSILCDNSSSFSQHPIANVFSQGGFSMSKTMYNILSGLGGQPWPSSVTATTHPAIVDPRGPVMFDPTSSNSGTTNAAYMGRWTGTNPGLAATNDETSTVNNSRIGKYVYGNVNRRFYVLKYSEICFLLAEAKVRFPAWNTGSGTAEDWYKNGIRSNMAEWGITTGIDTYLANTDPNINGTTVAYTHTAGNYNTELDKIITQKWIALFPEGGWEAWSDHRRLQKPKFIPFENVNTQWFPGTYNGTDSPQNYIRRAAYPVSEQTLNKANLDNAMQSLGGVYVGYVRKPMWWDPYKEDGTLK